jgi:hypothetical protein
MDKGQAFDDELIYQEVDIPEGCEATIENKKVIIRKKETEAERIKRALISLLKSDSGRDTTSIYGISIDTMISWVRRQGVDKKDSLVFKTLSHLLRLITPDDRAIFYCTRLAESLESEGYLVDSRIIRESIKMMKGEEVPMATMDEEEQVVFQDGGGPVQTIFKDGDWISNGRYTRHILSHNDHYYMFEDGTAYHIIDVDKKYHSWTIKDARNGDVLVSISPSGSEQMTQVFIFREIKDRDYVKGAVEYHCRLVEGEFKINESGGYMGCSDDNFIPADAMIRRQLFTKMEASGYRWDEESGKPCKINTTS